MGIVFRNSQTSGDIPVDADPVPTIVVGDSTSRGTSDAGLAYRVTWAGFVPRAHGEVINEAFDGYTYVLQLARIADWQDEGTVTNRKILHVALGINDLNTGRTAVQLIADIIAFAAAARPHFRWMSVQTITSSSSWTNNATKLGYWRIVNAWLRANWASHYDYLVDVAANPTYGADYAWEDTDVFLDGTHLVPLHNRKLYDLFYARAHALARDVVRNAA